ncbi:hypothetical protein EVAR_65084_1 [Eumeta japonica]|uniref:Uncharacterized protein n=1 Tax=Eumeta variegata TaxID=151549 RepID=A0A4C1Z5H7_EUMVA|nr:hypothetical protein EVAR_65084_1 [Eumeta japonica]
MECRTRTHQHQGTVNFGYILADSKPPSCLSRSLRAEAMTSHFYLLRRRLQFSQMCPFEINTTEVDGDRDAISSRRCHHIGDNVRLLTNLNPESGLDPSRKKSE